MKQKLKAVLILLLCAGLWGSCAKELTLDTGETFVVVECVLTCDSIQHLNLSFTRPKAEKRANPVITEAIASLYDETNAETAGMFQYSGSDWTLPYSPIPGHDYRLEVDVAGYDLVTARVTMPDQVNIDSFMAGANNSNKYGEQFLGTVFRISSLPERTWISAIAYANKKYTIIEDICTDYPYVDDFNVTGALYEPVFLNYDRWNTGEYPGWYVCDVLSGRPLHRRYIRATHLQDEETKAEEEDIFTISGSFYVNCDINRAWELGRGVSTPLGTKGGILFESLSEDYDQYLIDAFHFKDLQSSTDMSTVYMRDNVRSNVEGGVGIFGAKTQCLVTWDMRHKDYDFYVPFLSLEQDSDLGAKTSTLSRGS